ncbi:hypothetical protein LCGC14_0694390 [marine sediment metagenome]|uniref:Uncharacterized protein n=1 Tax=marine sediment metagenome TaxID=412755 RepID=A0A0F9R4Y6_9ZZZZ
MKKIYKRVVGYTLIVIGFLYNIIPPSIFIWTGRLIHRVYRVPFLGLIIVVAGVIILIRSLTRK